MDAGGGPQDSPLSTTPNMVGIVAFVVAMAAAAYARVTYLRNIAKASLSWYKTESAWLSVRTKALELVRQREGLTARVQFLHMSMISSRLRDPESKIRWDELSMELSWPRVDGLVESQRGETGRLEALVQYVAGRGERISGPKAHMLGGHGANS